LRITSCNSGSTCRIRRWKKRAQTERVLQKLSAILEAAGSSLAPVVKTTVFLKNMSDFAAMNEVYGRYFTAEPPARSTVRV